MDMIGLQKALADRVYVLLGKFDILLAGGGPRDWHIGQAARDLDFYVYSGNPEADAQEIGALIDTALVPLGDKEYKEKMDGEPSLLAVYEGQTHGQKVQFMFVEMSPLYFVKEKFDLSICKVWYKHGEICMDWEARLSFRERLIVMKNGYNKHAAKLMERTPWHRFAFMGSWDRALMIMGDRAGRLDDPLFENFDEVDEILFAEEGPVVGRALHIQAAEPGMNFINEGQVPDPQADEVAFNA